VRDSFGTLQVRLKILLLNLKIIIILIGHWIGASVIGAPGASAVTCRRLSSCWFTAAGIPAVALAFASIFWFQQPFHCLKVPKCENFHRTDSFYFFTIKPLWVGDFRAKIKNSKL
jgi:hypothetical protein